MVSATMVYEQDTPLEDPGVSNSIEVDMVDAGGFEPPAAWLQTKRSSS